MNLHLVTYFLAVVDRGGVTKAARALYISQPSLSQSIRTLERRLGVTLFDRVGRRLTLTDEGRTFEFAARRIVADVERAEQKMSTIRNLESGTVDIATFSAFSIDPTVELVRRFRASHPHITLRISETRDPAGVLSALRRGKAEVGITDLATDHPGMASIPLSEQELVLAIPPHLATGLPDPLPRARVRDIPMVVDLGSPGALVNAREMFGTCNVVVDCAHPTAVWEFVRRGTGGTLAPRSVAEQQMSDAIVIALDPPVARSVGLITRADELTPAADAFISSAPYCTKKA
ncbi:LysR family transcriptional regulator [Rhodococcus sp. C3V]|uniref:LysR family transcriptional regulator n=1 Tax=Rhodococcus sp. C3V TaxID=3034165 RepID=UPI0023E1370E|nr:LysR family transcriptional regulator [Rhodococcus sp. C3V]MDF3319935.1 LysR family transcriptional regulator [Rhodococcus sp. C3V]